MSISGMSDADFLGLMNSMVATISGDLPGYPGITALMVTEFGTVRDDLSDKLLVHNTAQDAARAATVDKNFERGNGEEQVRKFRSLLKANDVTDAKYAAIGIPATESFAPPRRV